jgi:hypothetical protein
VSALPERESDDVTRRAAVRQVEPEQQRAIAASAERRAS